MTTARGLSARSVFRALTLAAICAQAFILLIAPPDGVERAQLLQFVGRFHPLSVHLPIALLILVPIMELAGRTRYFPSLLSAVDFVLGTAICGAIASTSLGWCLARSGGYSGPLITQHMWGGVTVAAVAWLCWTLRERSVNGPNRLYAVTLIATVAIICFTGYRGGQLSQGESHLTEFIPEPLGKLLRVSANEDASTNSTNGGPSTFYGARIQPVFNQQCVTCHGRTKHKANLRLDSYDALMRGGKHGAVIKAGDVKGSDLLRRIMLSPTDDDFMPPDNRRPVPPNNITRIQQWIAAGASGTLPADAIKDGAPALEQPTTDVTFEELDPAVVAKERSALAATVAQVQQRLPNVVDYDSRGSANIAVNAAWMGKKFGDDELAALAPLGERIVIADFSSTSITDKSASAIASMKNLRVLRLMHTKITDLTVQALGPLAQLQVLSIFDTPVTAAAFTGLTRLPKILHIYAGETKLSASSSVPQEIRNKLVF